MTSEESEKELTIDDGAPTPLVTRSTVPSGLKYQDYRGFLRRDFLWSCAYCTIAESEATSIAFTIDHYEPQRARPDLRNTYSNLLYCCSMCNTYKADRVPSKDALNAGVRFFRPDLDHRSNHFSLKELFVESKSRIGEFTIKALSLNRQPLRRLRKIRSAISSSHKRIEEGILALKRAKLDQLPRGLRGNAASAIAKASATFESLTQEFEETLLSQARSPLHGDEDEDRAAQEQIDLKRQEELKEMEAMWPGAWRARHKKTGTE